MDSGLKQRLIGAAVLIALAVIFLPMLVQGPAPDSGVSDLSLQVPAAPGGDYVTRDLPLVVPAASSSEGLLGDGRLPTVDTATARPEGDTVSEDAADLASDVDVLPMPEAVPQPEAAAQQPLPANEPDARSARSAAAGAAREIPPSAAPLVAAEEAAKPEPAAPRPAATEAPATPAPRLPPATAGGDYAVSFGAYGSRADAGIVVNRLRESNLPAYIEETRVGDRDAWRVRIGPYASRADAEAARVRASGIGARVQASVVALDAASPAQPRPAAQSQSQQPSRSQRAAASSPAPASVPAAAGTGFAVQVGAFGRPADATALRDRLRAAGIGAFTESVQTDSGTLTRVKAGPVATRADAEQLKARVKSGFGIDGLVRSHP